MCYETNIHFPLISNVDELVEDYVMEVTDCAGNFYILS